MKTTYKQRRMIWRMTSARPIKKSRIKRKLKIDATAAFFATHEILAMCSIDTSRGGAPSGIPSTLPSSNPTFCYCTTVIAATAQ